jgi:hypothetical protein
MATEKRHADEALMDFVKESSKNVSYRFRDDWDIAKSRGMLGLITFLLGVVIPFFFDARPVVLILVILTGVLWWNFIIRSSFLVGTIGTIEGILPIFQTDKEMEGPVTNDGRIAAAYTYNFLANIAAILLAVMFVPLLTPPPMIHTFPFWYSVAVALLVLAGIFSIEIPTARIATVGGKKPDEKGKAKEKK